MRSPLRCNASLYEARMPAVSRFDAQIASQLSLDPSGDTFSQRGRWAVHPNARLIETLYSAIRANDADAITACYAPDASFEDIAFELEGREMIRDMWRMICDAEITVLGFEVKSADDRR